MKPHHDPVWCLCWWANCDLHDVMWMEKAHAHTGSYNHVLHVLTEYAGTCHWKIQNNKSIARQ